MSRLPRLVAAAFVLLLVSAAGARADEKNLFTNGGFEETLKGHPWMPAGWDTSRAGTETVFFGRDAFSAHSGGFGVSVANASTTLPLYHNWSQTIDVGPESWGKDLVLKVWTKSNGVDGRGYVLLQAFRDTVGKVARQLGVSRDVAGRRAGFPGVNDPIADLAWKRVTFDDPETDWVPREVRVYVAPTTNIVTARLGLYGTGQVMFDDVSLAMVDAQPAPEVPLNTNLLQNPGFEGSLLGWEVSMPPFPPFIADRDSTVAHTGKSSMHMFVKSGLVSGRTGVAQVFSNRALIGKRLRLTAFAKAESLQSQIGLQLFFHTTTGMKVEKSSMQVYGTTGWKPMIVESDVPPDTYEIWAWIMYTAPIPGHAYFDDLSLTVVGPANGQPTPDAWDPEPKKSSSSKVASKSKSRVR
jgi:hypothetical protein